jgi:hypothetical protein
MVRLLFDTGKVDVESKNIFNPGTATVNYRKKEQVIVRLLKTQA